MNLQKLICTREGHRKIIDRKLASITEDTCIDDIQDILEYIQHKAELIQSLNDKIANQTDAADIEAEIIESEEYIFDLLKQIKRLSKRAKSSQNTTKTLEQQEENATGNASNNKTMSYSQESVSQQSSDDLQRNVHHSKSHHRLPKLSLPEFDGDVTQWQTFWDTYEASVHTNPTLSEVEKFSYLRSLLHNTAARCIEGFPLTNSNYLQAVDLLKERFGQPHKIVSSYMQSLIELPQPNKTIDSLVSFSDNMETNIRGLEALGQSQETFGTLLVPIIMGKLPAEVLRNMTREHGEGNWTLPEVRKAVRKEITILEAGQKLEVTEQRATATFFTSAKNRVSKETPIKQRQHASSTRQPRCPFCDGNHPPHECKIVKQLEDRMSIVKKNNLCFNCLKQHRVSLCTSKYRCRKCQGKHHTSICKQNAASVLSTLNPTAAVYSPDKVEPHSEAVLHSTINQRNVLLKTAVATVSSESLSTESNILFDEGAQRSFITTDLANKLHMKETGRELIHLAAFGDKQKRSRYMSTGTIFIQANTRQKIAVDVLITPTIAVALQNTPEEVKNLPYLKGLKLAHATSDGRPFEIDLLIGADNYWKIVEDHVIRGEGPTAVSSKIGYLLSGPMPSTTKKTETLMLNVMTSPIADFDLERFWNLESLGISPETSEKLPCARLQEYQQTSITFDDGRYTATLPWKEDHAPLPTNYQVTKRRTEATIRRLAQDPPMLKAYGKIIADQERRGFIEKVDISHATPDATDYRVHYIPHHGVKKESATTPIRIVYDCSCRMSHNHPSLNDCLSSAPPDLNDISSILVRFRLQRFAVSTDIEKAFLHVQLAEQDRDVTRFFWLSDPEDPNSPLIIYRFKAVLFGATCSPFILNATILKHLEVHRENWTSDILKRDIYVDNVLTGFDKEEDTLRFFDDTRTLMSSAGFNMYSWNSNSQLLKRKAEDEHVQDNDNETKVLGMRWNSADDKLKFHERLIPIADVVTKREILQHTSQIYDPLGILSPVTIRAKLLLQELWQEQLDWDTPVPEAIEHRWKQLVADLNDVASMKLQRHYFQDSSDTTPELHIFVDASQTSYAAAAYICRENNTSLVMSKSRVAPLKGLSLPRLELMAAVIGARLAKHIEQSIRVCEIYMWSDSQVVLHWLRSKRPLKRFIANRVAEIQELTDHRKWRYCPSENNPADLPTRGMTNDQFVESKLWHTGPQWLANKTSWPTWEPEPTGVLTVTMEDEDTQDMQAKPLKTTQSSTIAKVIETSRYSSLQKMLRVTAYVQRFISNCRSVKSNKNVGHLSVHELVDAERKWISSIQSDVYTEEIKSLQTSIGHPTLVRQLQLFLDADGLIRCGGRIHNATLGELTKFPYLLPPGHTFTKLVIQDAHQRRLHTGVNDTVTALRQKYWIPAIRRNVMKVIRRCIVCKKIVGQPYTAPDPPPLPKIRVEDAPPFSVTGVDFTGALSVRGSNGRETKAYICLFTCAATRAVHLEVVHDLSETAFLQCFRRFISRKSQPRLMVSDNCTTFTAAAGSLRRLSQSQTVQADLNMRGTEWQFIPKRAPWFGGWWERLIGLTKTVLKKILGRSFVDYTTLQTIMTEIEAVINERPITYVSSGAGESEPLTPAQLLYGRNITRLPYEDTPEASTTTLKNTRDRAQRMAQLLNNFRERWRTEYLTALRERKLANGRNQQNIKTGDVVLVQDATPRCQWKLAVITEVTEGNDGLIRSAVIRTSSGVTSRPITKLIPLEIGPED